MSTTISPNLKEESAVSKDVSAKIRFGVDQVLANCPDELKTKRVGLLTNDAATTATLPHPYALSRQALAESEVNLVALFSPEHGIGAAAADGAKIGDVKDLVTGLPVHSLYGKNFAPTDEMLSEIDVFVIDVPDIGARFYTYIWTMSYILEKCAKVGMPIYVLDRPNPVGGVLEKAEGPLLDESTFNSLVGRWRIPIRHSLTMGELAKLWNTEREIGAELTVIPMSGWDREMLWEDTGLSFVPTSPAMNSGEEALIYPGTTLFEGLNISECRGTSFPFRGIGAPWIDSMKLACWFNELGLEGVVARAMTFSPSDSWYKGESCGGVMLHVTDRDLFKPVASLLHLVHLIWMHYPEEVKWAEYPTANNYTGADHFDRLIGDTEIRQVIEGRPSVDEIRGHIAKWTEVGDWSDRVKEHLLY
ncbi:DUF1343 domain-containing protein [Planctomycetota bacterium]|nr:DUF1343 domain-containing protein [Planctomycetota bacterium]